MRCCRALMLCDCLTAAVMCVVKRCLDGSVCVLCYAVLLLAAAVLVCAYCAAVLSCVYSAAYYRRGRGRDWERGRDRDASRSRSRSRSRSSSRCAALQALCLQFFHVRLCKPCVCCMIMPAVLLCMLWSYVYSVLMQCRDRSRCAGVEAGCIAAVSPHSGPTPATGRVLRRVLSRIISFTSSINTTTNNTKHSNTIRRTPPACAQERTIFQPSLKTNPWLCTAWLCVHYASSSCRGARGGYSRGSVSTKCDANPVLPEFVSTLPR